MHSSFCATTDAGKPCILLVMLVALL